MHRYHRALIAGALALSLLTITSRARAQLTADENKCQLGTSLAVSKFITDKAKCLIKCQQGARKTLNPASDCNSPFGGATASCVSLATSKATGLEESKCQKDCPECYGGGTGNCTTDANMRVADAESQIDTLSTSVFCDDSGSGDGLNKSEAKCQDTVAKTLSNFAKKKFLCYSKCRAAERKGDVAAGSCTPPASDPTTQACITKEENKAAGLIDKKCEASVSPSADKPECYGSATGSGWAAIVESAVDSSQGSLYCSSPSGAFLEN